jgi:hypothetical protein
VALPELQLQEERLHGQDPIEWSISPDRDELLGKHGCVDSLGHTHVRPFKGRNDVKPATKLEETI